MRNRRITLCVWVGKSTTGNRTTLPLNCTILCFATGCVDLYCDVTPLIRTTGRTLLDTVPEWHWLVEWIPPADEQ